MFIFKRSRKSMLLFRVLSFLALILPFQRLFAEELIQVPAAIQISSKVSDGKYSIPEIVKICRQEKFKVVIITDRDLMRWEYGVSPWRNILKKTVEADSIFKYGLRRYLNEFKSIQESNPDLVLIPGIESAPFYYWQGSLFSNNLELIDWHKHLITIGLKDLTDYQGLPILGNKKGLALPFSPGSLVLFWPLLLLAGGIWCLNKRVYDYRDEKGRALAPCSKSWKRSGIFLILLSVFFLANNFPFAYYRFDQYRGELGAKPYQSYIDYVSQHNGLTFWAHPEAENKQRIESVSIRTEKHPYSLIESKDYTGFAVFFEGFKTVGAIDGIWDKLLKEYCSGRRKKPIWAIAGLSFDSNGSLEDYLKLTRTVLLLPNLTEQEVVQAMGRGRMYALMGRNSGQLVLNKFRVKDPATGLEKGMGESLEVKAFAQVEIDLDLLNGQQQLFKIKLIRDGEVIKTFESPAPFRVTYLDEQSPTGKKYYYRLEIQGPDVAAVTNPIFVEKTG
jgi:hypothetical protein